MMLRGTLALSTSSNVFWKAACRKTAGAPAKSSVYLALCFHHPSTASAICAVPTRIWNMTLLNLLLGAKAEPSTNASPIKFDLSIILPSTTLPTYKMDAAANASSLLQTKCKCSNG